MNTLFIVILFIGEALNIFWMIFRAPTNYKIGQILGWGLLSLVVWVLMVGYFSLQEKREIEEKNKSKKREK